MNHFHLSLGGRGPVTVRPHIHLLNSSCTERGRERGEIDRDIYRNIKRKEKNDRKKRREYAQKERYRKDNQEVYKRGKIEEKGRKI